jgi:hypothetical protein
MKRKVARRKTLTTTATKYLVVTVVAAHDVFRYM